MYRLEALDKAGVANTSKIPFSIRILLENLLRFEDDRTVRAGDIEYVAKWDPAAKAREIQFRPARVLLQDFTGVPAVCDLAAMRDALARWEPIRHLANPLIPADLVIDHSVQVDTVRIARSIRNQCAARVSTESGALCAAALGAERRSITSAWCHPIPASCIR